MIDVIPSQKEVDKVNAIAKKIISKINLKDAVTSLGGSGAKNTWLKGSKEIDVYVRFNYKRYNNKSNELADILHSHLKNKFKKISRLHGSRDYFQVFDEGFTIEVIPILDIQKESEAKNITDISQLHVKYVKKYPKLANEIRLAKTFAKAQEVYGAESYIQGFSGYVLELLVIHYKGFKNLVKNVAKWKEETIIGNKKDVEVLNFSKKNSPLILIDPVQSSRNAAAALGDKRYKKFIADCKKYVNKPSESFFVKKPHKFKSGGKHILLKVKPKTGKRDIVGAKLMKAFEHLKRRLEDEGFEIKNSKWDWNDYGLFYYELKSDKLSLYQEVKGPPGNLIEHVANFKKKYKKIYFKKGYAYAKTKRKYTDARKAIKIILKEKEVTDRLSSVA
ncbi:MAG: hypothetical protein Q8R00_00120 [Candidatus Nanoarchaeia archaeon]|nr:hypothetical protein [Candidatus Nanoarchaeia archaeon]